jgi:hypothetical protein
MGCRSIIIVGAVLVALMVVAVAIDSTAMAGIFGYMLGGALIFGTVWVGVIGAVPLLRANVSARAPLSARPRSPGRRPPGQPRRDLLPEILHTRKAVPSGRWLDSDQGTLGRT